MPNSFFKNLIIKNKTCFLLSISLIISVVIHIYVGINTNNTNKNEVIGNNLNVTFTDPYIPTQTKPQNTVTQPTYPVMLSKAKGVVLQGDLNIRTEPNKLGTNIIRQFNKVTEIICLEEKEINNSIWWRIEYEGTSGWTCVKDGDKEYIYILESK